MTRTQSLVALVVTAAIALLAVWIGRNTYWEDLKVPMPPKGEALVNPFYAAQRFAERLGANTTWDRMLTVPRSDAVIVVSTWHWGLSRTRRAALERWVESGGRLVVDDRLMDPSGEFEEWTGIAQTFPDFETLKNWKAEDDPVCRRVHAGADEERTPAAEEDALWLCDLGISWLESDRTLEWALRDKKGIQAARVAIGRGSVTVINASPFRERALFNGDHGRVFVAATGLRRGDEVHFLSEDRHPSLVALAWRYGAPVVAVGLALLAAVLWRGAVRFGPLAPPTVAARRSLADQIRGTGRFALHHGSGQSLHAACVRALDEAAQRRVKHYAVLAPDERLAAVARLSGFDRDSLAAAIHHPGWRTAAALRRTLALLEAARRETLVTHRRPEHGTR